ncbi:MAG: preprotein translocase subunit SecG [Clostridia bacterium]|nr:preprotein translocase subunit SecG [Clostridia bacterium]
MLNLLLNATTYPAWITSSFPIIRIILLVLIAMLAVAITVIVMVMESHPEGGTNVISGQSDSFYARNKGASKEGRLKIAIIICGILIAILAIVFWILWQVYPTVG